jgi:hypothetical protein
MPVTARLATQLRRLSAREKAVLADHLWRESETKLAPTPAHTSQTPAGRRSFAPLAAMKTFKEADGYADDLQAAYDYYKAYSHPAALRFLVAYESATR